MPRYTVPEDLEITNNNDEHWRIIIIIIINVVGHASG